MLLCILTVGVGASVYVAHDAPENKAKERRRLRPLRHENVYALVYERR
jgi:hypothetical protein